jgi:hypothetical protein
MAMPIKDITSAIGPSAATQVDAMHYLEEPASELEALLADPAAFLKKNNLRTTDHSQIHTTVVRRPVAAAVAARIRVIGVIVAHFSNCDTVIIIFVA